MSKSWIPKKGQSYYIIVNSHVGGGIHKRVWEDSDTDKAYHKELNCFRSKKEAEFIYKTFNKNF